MSINARRTAIAIMVVFFYFQGGVEECQELNSEEIQNDGFEFRVDRYWPIPVRNGLLEPEYPDVIQVATESGVKEFRSIAHGNSDQVFHNLIGRVDPSMARRFIAETNGQVYYNVLAPKDSPITIEGIQEIATALGMEIRREPRKIWGYRIIKNGEANEDLVKYVGQPRYMEIDQEFKRHAPSALVVINGSLCGYDEFLSGGLVYRGVRLSAKKRDYLEGVTMDELATFFEKGGTAPVVNKTDDVQRYSFSLLSELKKPFSVSTPTVLPNLGLSIVPGEITIEAYVLTTTDQSKAEPAQRKP